MQDLPGGRARVITVVELGLGFCHVILAHQHCAQIRNSIKNNGYGYVMRTEMSSVIK